MEAVEAPGDDNSNGPVELEPPGKGKCICWGGGELADVDPTDPGSLNPWVLLSSGVSKKLKLNSEPASKDTSGVILSGDGALPRFPLKDWSILKTSIVLNHQLKRTSAPQSLGTVRGAASSRGRLRARFAPPSLAYSFQVVVGPARTRVLVVRAHGHVITRSAASHSRLCNPVQLMRAVGFLAR